MLEPMTHAEIKFEDGQEVQDTRRPDSPKGRPAVIRRLLNADCTRCHGSGKEPGRESIPLEYDGILEELDKAGLERARYSNARGEDWNKLYDAWERIRKLWQQAGEEGLDMNQGLAAGAVRLTRAQFSAETRGWKTLRSTKKPRPRAATKS
jgi:hypothetical protein